MGQVTLQEVRGGDESRGGGGMKEERKERSEVRGVFSREIAG